LGFVVLFYKVCLWEWMKLFNKITNSKENLLTTIKRTQMILKKITYSLIAQ